MTDWLAPRSQAIAIYLLAIFALASACTSPDSRTTSESSEIEQAFDEDATTSSVIGLSGVGLGTYPFGSDFDEVLTDVSLLLGKPDEIRRDNTGGCGYFLGCDLAAHWEGFAIGGSYRSNAFTVWGLDPKSAAAAHFELPRVSMEDSMRPEAWPHTVDVSYNAPESVWQASIGKTGIEAFLTVAPPETGVAPGVAPEAPENFQFSWLYASNWAIGTIDESEENVAARETAVNAREQALAQSDRTSG